MFGACAEVVGGIRQLRDRLHAAVDSLTAEAKCRRAAIDSQCYPDTALRTSLMDAELARQVYERERPDLAGLFEAWLAFPKDIENRQRKGYDDVTCLWEFLDRGMGLRTEKQNDFVVHHFIRYASLPIAEMIRSIDDGRIDARIEALIGAASPRLHINRNLDLEGYAIPELTFAGADQGEGSPMAKAIGTISEQVHIFDNGASARLEVYRFVFGVPGFVLESMRLQAQ